MEKGKKPLLRKLGSIALDIVGELVAVVIMFAIGAGIMALVDEKSVLEEADPDQLILLGALAVLAAFGILFAVIAIIRKIKRR